MLGGLGSQMFKYAFLLSVKNQCSQPLIIDTSFYLQNKSWNGYELGKVFQIKTDDLVNDLSKEQIESIKNGSKKYLRIVIKHLTNLLPLDYYFLGNRTTYKKYGFWANIARVLKRKILMFMYYSGKNIKYPTDYLVRTENIYYDEFPMNSDEYISCIRNELVKTFEFPTISGKRNMDVLHRIISTSSVAIHIRRTDHMRDNVKLFKRHYFMKAVKYIKNHSSSKLCFLIFSDDIEWCKQNKNELGLSQDDEIVFVDWNKGDNAYKDMQLMTYCQHNIIPISSFSWWGYYLSKRENKIVCAPIGYWKEVSNHF